MIKMYVSSCSQQKKLLLGPRAAQRVVNMACHPISTQENSQAKSSISQAQLLSKQQRLQIIQDQLNNYDKKISIFQNKVSSIAQLDIKQEDRRSTSAYSSSRSHFSFRKNKKLGKKPIEKRVHRPSEQIVFNSEKLKKQKQIISETQHLCKTKIKKIYSQIMIQGQIKFEVSFCPDEEGLLQPAFLSHEQLVRRAPQLLAQFKKFQNLLL